MNLAQRIGQEIKSIKDNTYIKQEVDDAIDDKIDDSSTSTSSTWSSNKIDESITTAIGAIDLSTKQDVLVSGTNIKTLNSNSLLGSGDIEISSGVQGFYPEKFVMEDIFTTSTTVTVPNGAKQMMAYVFGVGGNGVANTSSGGGGGCAYGLVNVTAGSTVTLTIGTAQGSTSKLTYGGIDLLTAIGANNATAGTASKHASVLNPSGAYRGGSGIVSSEDYGGASSGSPFGVGKNATAFNGGASWSFSATTQYGAGLGSSDRLTFKSNIKINDVLVRYFSPFTTTPLANNVSDGGSGVGGSNGFGGFGAGGGYNYGSHFGGGSGYTSSNKTNGYSGGASKNGTGGASCIVIFWA